jgi:hypothetical protein
MFLYIRCFRTESGVKIIFIIQAWNFNENFKIILERKFLPVFEPVLGENVCLDKFKVYLFIYLFFILFFINKMAFQHNLGYSRPQRVEWLTLYNIPKDKKKSFQEKVISLVFFRLLGLQDSKVLTFAQVRERIWNEYMICYDF